jgi:TolB protein
MKFLALVCCLGLSVVACGDDPERTAPLPQPSALPPSPAPTPPGPQPGASTGPIAFVSTRDGSPHIYLANADGTAATRLTSGEKPAWSRDGRSLAFQRATSIFVINADGSGERWLGPGRSPDWSPDGARIVFAADTIPDGIFVLNADGSGRTKLLSGEFLQPGDGVHSPAWSPDGGRIEFVRANYDEPWDITSWTRTAPDLVS